MENVGREFNPNGVVANVTRPPNEKRIAATALRLVHCWTMTQGSSFLATLGWRTQSLWDCLHTNAIPDSRHLQIIESHFTVRQTSRAATRLRPIRSRPRARPRPQRRWRYLYFRTRINQALTRDRGWKL